MRWGGVVVVLGGLSIWSQVGSAEPVSELSSDCGRQASDFRIYASMHYREPPDFCAGSCIAELKTIYARELYAGRIPEGEPKEAEVKEVARRQDPKRPAVLDIEHLPFGDFEEARESAAIYNRVMGWFKEAAPDVDASWYAVAQYRNTRISRKPPGTEPFQIWQEYNDSVASIGRTADFVALSFYNWSKDIALWEADARRAAEEARRVYRDRAILAYVWPRFHDHGPEDGAWMPAEQWRRVLEVSHEILDGLIIWGGHEWKDGPLRDGEWDEAAPWWVETKAFMAETGLCPLPQ